MKVTSSKRLLMSIQGWRVANGQVTPPASSTGRRWYEIIECGIDIPTFIEKALYALREKYPSVQFPVPGGRESFTDLLEGSTTWKIQEKGDNLKCQLKS